jgi:predicted acetyltransferase
VIPVPDAVVLVKLGSIVRHVEELLGPDGHSFDAAVLDDLLADPGVVAWLRKMDSLALLPVRR